ncbi:MAG: hypothetical protein H0V46_08275 [Sphingomonas sp.]|nr:hypothetical protein [Sphingomonas sp.]
MRIVMMATALVGLVASTAAQAAAPTKINLQGVLRETPGGPLYLKFTSAGDLDGDGLADEGFLKLTCAGGELRSVHYHVNAPRDSA